MTETAKTAAAIGGVVLVAATISAGLFVTTGSNTTVWFVLVGIPLLLVGGISLYVRGVIAQSGTGEDQYVRQQARLVAESFQETLREYNELRVANDRWEPGVEAQAESIAGDLESNGVEVDLESGTFELTATQNADLQEIERIKSDIDAFEQTVVDEFRAFVEAELSEIEDGLGRLEGVGLLTDTRVPERPTADTTLEDARDTLERGRTRATDAIEDAVRTVREMGRGDRRPDDTGSVEANLEAAETAIEHRDVSDAVESVLDARDQLRDEYSGSFDAEREELVALLDAVDSIDVEAHVDAEYVEEIESITESVRSLDSALDIAELGRYRSRLRGTCVDVVASMERDLEDATETLRDAELPSGYYTEPAVAGESYVAELSDEDDLSRFTERWTDVADRLIDALDTAKTKVAVVDAYDDVADVIDAELEASGAAVEDDLPVRDAGQFLGLYARRNPDVEFVPDGPAVRTGPVETFDVSVEVAYERGGPVRTATLALSGPGYDAEATVETRIAGTVDFDSVPAGDHTLVAEPGDSDFAPVERTVSIDDDSKLTVEFGERGLQEQVCEDVDADVDEILSEVRPELESLFEEDGYVSTALSLPVRPEYAPCLLATWATTDDHDVARDDGEIVVFDRDSVEREVRNVIRYNLDAGDSIAFDELERNFLSTPVPRSVLREIADDAGSETEYDVTTTDNAIQTK